MKQILQNLRSGETTLDEVPVPAIERGSVLIQSRCSLVSQGTEKMLVDFARASLLQKARSQPERVKEVIRKIRTEGLLPTLEAVFRRLDEPLPLGYCNVGVVAQVGVGVTGLRPGDRVVSNGPHAEFVSVPENLVAKIPDLVSDREAVFTVLGAIGLQGVRLVAPQLGETVVVIGLGLIGQLAAQLAQAAGCRVVGFDFDETKVSLAKQSGIQAIRVGEAVDPVRQVLDLTDQAGADAVLIAASSSSNAVVSQAARMSRKRGRIVLVGVVGLELNRNDFYEKELTFQVSCSYGPGRYDHSYEEKGLDYPLAYVRWTANRNFQAVLGAMQSGALKVSSLLAREVPLEQFGELYRDLQASGMGSVIRYGDSADRATTVRTAAGSLAGGPGALAIVGAGNFAKMTALPALAKSDVRIKTIVSSRGVSAASLARRYGIAVNTTDLGVALGDPEISGVLITTRHHLHAGEALAALEAGKHVLVEKPLCLTRDELRRINRWVAAHPGGPTITVGFNRRFSRHAETMKSLLRDGQSPISLVLTMNAGSVPNGHWVNDPAVGGGRLLGEACHYIDLAIFLTGSLITEIAATKLGADGGTLLLRHASGSLSVVNYLTEGNRGLSKERIEAHSQGRSLALDDFRVLLGYGFRRFRKLSVRQDKGHVRQFQLFSERVRTGGAALIPWSEIANGASAALAIDEAVRAGCFVPVPDSEP